MSTLLIIILSWSAGVLCVLLILIFRINPEDHMQTNDRLRDLDGKPLYVSFQTPIMMPIDLQLEIKRRKAIEWLGQRWILHPCHSARKQS